MSICVPALDTESIPSCLDLLEVGDITPDTAVTVYIKDLTLDATFVFQETSYPSTGRVIIDVSPYEFADKHSYQVWMTAPQEPVTNYIDFTVEGSTTPTKIAQLKFHELTDNGSQFPFPSVVLKAA